MILIKEPIHLAHSNMMDILLLQVYETIHIYLMLVSRLDVLSRVHETIRYNLQLLQQLISHGHIKNDIVYHNYEHVSGHVRIVRMREMELL